MINRALTRQKTLQVLYSHSRDEGRRLDSSLKMLRQSLDQGYELYLHMLALLVDIRDFAERRAESQEMRAQRLHEKLDMQLPDRRLADNGLLLLLKENEALQAFREKRRELWKVGDTLMKRLADLFEQSELFRSYLQEPAQTFERDAELIRELYRRLLVDNSDVEEMLEENSIFWNDDRQVVDSFVVKTLRRFRADSRPDLPLLPQYDEGEGAGFGERLLTAAVEREDELRELISRHVKGWDYERVALMDVLIMQLALAEILTFPDVPLNVSLNEYISLAKAYSTPRSGVYVNGVLDAVVAALKEDGKLLK